MPRAGHISTLEARVPGIVSHCALFSASLVKTGNFYFTSPRGRLHQTMPVCHITISNFILYGSPLPNSKGAGPAGCSAGSRLSGICLSLTMKGPKKLQRSPRFSLPFSASSFTYSSMGASSSQPGSVALLSLGDVGAKVTEDQCPPCWGRSLSSHPDKPQQANMIPHGEV